jgi:hypothetical protein
MPARTFHVKHSSMRSEQNAGECPLRMRASPFVGRRFRSRDAQLAKCSTWNRRATRPPNVLKARETVRVGSAELSFGWATFCPARPLVKCSTWNIRAGRPANRSRESVSYKCGGIGPNEVSSRRAYLLSADMGQASWDKPVRSKSLSLPRPASTSASIDGGR